MAKMTEDQKQAAKQRDKELGEQATAALEDAEFVEKMEAAIANMPADCKVATYGQRNQALYFLQVTALGITPTGDVKTFNAWLKEGRAVRKGSVGIRITVPRTKDADTKEADAKNGNTEDIAGFWMRSFFDHSQTDPKEQQ